MSEERKAQLQSLRIEREEDAPRGGVPLPAVIAIAVAAALIAAIAVWLLLPRGSAPESAETQAAAQTAASPAGGEGESAAPAQSAPPRAGGLAASGYVVARRQATVSAEITGRIQEILFEEGAEVEKGQVLARLDDERARYDLALAQARAASAGANIEALRAQYTEAENVFRRASRLAEQQAGAEANVTAARAQLDSLAAQIQASRAELNVARTQAASAEDYVDRHIIRAPFAGVVIAKNAQVGEILSPVSAGGGFTRTGVATLVDMASLEIEVDVNEGQIQRVSAGQRVEAVLDAYPDWRIPAHVEAIIPTADRARATIQVRVAFDERDSRILPDMAAQVTFLENRN